MLQALQFPDRCVPLEVGSNARVFSRACNHKPIAIFRPDINLAATTVTLTANAEGPVNSP